MKGGTHDLIDHVKGGQGGGVDVQQAVNCGPQGDFAFPGIVVPLDILPRQGIGQNGGRLVFMDFIFLEIHQVEMVFAKLL